MTVVIRVYGRSARVNHGKWQATSPGFVELLNAMTLSIYPPIEDTDADHTIATEVANKLGGTVVTPRIIRELPAGVIV